MTVKPLSPHQSLEHLQKKFTEFRSSNRSPARIPDDLRNEVLEAAAAGISPTRINAVIGVTSTQLARWKKETLPAPPAPRVLRVIKDTLPEGAKQAVPPGLRISFEAGRLLLELSY